MRRETLSSGPSRALDWWRRWHATSWPRRAPLKAAFLAAVVFLTLYPRLDRFGTWVSRVREMDSVIDPQHPALAPLEEQVRAELPADASAAHALQRVEHVVLQRVPYAWDWDVWSVMDYLPSVDEVFEKGREDCDGRAVVAASLLRRMGYDAWLACDLLHVWVQTPEGEAMGPTGATPTLTGPRPGHESPTLRPATAAVNLARGLSYGVSVFPLGRELLILAAIVLVALHPAVPAVRCGAGATLMLSGLFVLRHFGERAVRGHDGWDALGVGLGLILTATGLALLLWRKALGRAEAPAGSSDALEVGA